MRRAELAIGPRLRRQWLAEVAGRDPASLIAEPDPVLSDDQRERFERGLARLEAGEPLSRLRGWQSFWGLRFGLNEATLDPRDDSEVLVETALNRLPEHRPARLLDLGTGSGCLLLSVLRDRPMATGLGVDLSARALDAARDNARALDLADRAQFERSDWFGGVDGRFDLILCNPPYVARDETALMDRATLDHDPHSALFADNHGLAAYERLFPQLSQHLNPDGLALFEHGFAQQDRLVALAQRTGLRVVERLLDLSATPRAVLLGFSGRD